MRIPVDFVIDSCTISLALVAIIEPMTVSRLLTKGAEKLHTCIHDLCTQRQQTG